MLNAVLNVNKHFLQNCARNQINARYFYRWLINVFNGIDKKRIKEVGPDRACAEWLLKNGAAVKFKGAKEFLPDYNGLPDVDSKFFLEAVDATDSAIHHIGFPYFSGCKYIEEIKLVRCSSIENEALSLLSIVKDSLKDLEVIQCQNITDDALLHLGNLKGLQSLKLGGMPYVKDKSRIISELTTALPTCKITYDGEN